MSAFICGQDHFKALAIFASTRGHYGLNVDPRYIEGLKEGAPATDQAELATRFANILYHENIRSVSFRYSDEPYETLPGPIEKPVMITVNNRDLANRKYLDLSPVALLKMCDCLEYQSCETPTWDDTIAYRVLLHLRKAAVHALPGYDNAPWDFEAEGTPA